MALKEFVGEEQKIEVQRANVFTTLLQMYRDDEELVNHALNVTFTGESGVDLGGLTKELFTLFWVEANRELFTGEHYTVPYMPLHRQRNEMWKFQVLGRVLAHTAALLGSLPGPIHRGPAGMGQQCQCLRLLQVLRQVCSPHDNRLWGRAWRGAGS